MEHRLFKFWPSKAIYYVNMPEKDRLTLCTLGIGTTFGESILEGKPHSTTIVTGDHCELLRVEQRDFKLLWEKNKKYVDGMISSPGVIRNGPREEGQIYTLKHNTPDEKNIYCLRDTSKNSFPMEGYDRRSSPPVSRIKSYDSRESLGSRRGSYEIRESPRESPCKGRSNYDNRESPGRSTGSYDSRESPTRRAYDTYDGPRPRVNDSPTRLRGSDQGFRDPPMENRGNYSKQGSPIMPRAYYDHNSSPHRRRSDFARHDSPVRGSTESLPRQRYSSSPNNFHVHRQYSLELRDSPPMNRESYSPNRRIREYRDYQDTVGPFNEQYENSKSSPPTMHRSRRQPTPPDSRGSPSSKARYVRDISSSNRSLERCSSRNAVLPQHVDSYLSPTSHDGSSSGRNEDSYGSSNYVDESQAYRTRDNHYHNRGNRQPPTHEGPRHQDKKALSLPIQPNTTQPPRRASVSQNNRREEDTVRKEPVKPNSVPKAPLEKLYRAGWVLRTVILAHAGHLIRDRKYHLETYRNCMVGTEMVDWLLQLENHMHIVSRQQAVGIWQSLLEERVLLHVTDEHQFQDKYLFYRFCMDDSKDGNVVPSQITSRDERLAKDELSDVLVMLSQLGPDAMIRMILGKKPCDRTEEDLETINEELIHIEALSHLSSSVKKELATVLIFESHPQADTVLFNQGDEGKSWYIILKGSVNVVIYGKGVVCTLHEGDDFGKLALINDAPRAASIVSREDNCQFLRVDKDDFNRILRDVEANTVRLKEHGKDVLVLEKIPNSSADRGSQSHYKYSVMAGTSQKMLEYLLEARMDSKLEDVQDSFIEDFLLTHVTFMPSQQLCSELIRHYRADSNQYADMEFMMSSKRRVIQFVRYWIDVIHEPVFDDPIVDSFVNDLYEMVRADDKKYGTLDEELRMIARVHEEKQRYFEREQNKSAHKWKVSSSGQIKQLSDNGSQDNDRIERYMSMKPKDEIIFRVYCADHTYITTKAFVGATAETVKKATAEKTGLSGNLSIVEVKSNGEKSIFKDGDTSIPTLLTVNGRIYITQTDTVDNLTPIKEQEGPSLSSIQTLEVLGSRELAYELTLYDWELFTSIHEYELIYHVFGRHNFKKITSNLDVFLRRFNEIQYWVVTELCLTNTISKRVQLLRKFLKIADYCREYQNMNSFFAIVMGLSNVAISRMTSTWDRLNSKVRRTFTEFEAVIDPSRNHRAYRLSVAKMSPPIIPFMPLLMKDMTFTHEGNKTNNDGLVNFEKMHMISHSLRTMEHCRMEPFFADPPSSVKNEHEIRDYIRNLKVIDNQKRIGQLSSKGDSRR